MADKSKLWDPWKMFDVSPEESRAIKERAKMREALKSEWTKKYTNPMKSTTSGGFIFDPAVQRFMSLKNTQAEYFKGTFRSAMLGIVIYVVPISFLTWNLIRNKQKKEAKIRSGQIMYKDRHDKFFF